jgi:AraC-like DNA-binding protein
MGMIRIRWRKVFGTIPPCFTRICDFPDILSLVRRDMESGMTPPLIQELIEFDNARSRGKIRIATHVHHCFQMDVLLSGRMKLLLPGRTIWLRKGYGVLLPPLAPHGFEIAGAVHHVSFKFHVHPRYFASFSHEPCVFPLPAGELGAARVVRRWDRSSDVLTAQQALGAAMICLVGAMRKNPARQVKASLPTPELWAAVNAVITRPEDDWTVQKLAAMCDWTEGHFTRRFIEWFNQNPRRFLLESRMSIAARMLSAGELPVKAIAGRCGYATVHSFARAFKRATGMTPGRYVNPHGRL